MSTGWLLLRLALLIDPYAAKADVAGGVVGEIRGGIAPVVPNAPSEASLLVVVTPNVDLRVRSRRFGEFVLGYAPRILLRVPNPLQVKRPLFLHQIQATYGLQASPRWSLSGQALVSVGELDYTATALVFGPMQGTVPSDRVTSYAIGDLATTISGYTAPRQNLIIQPSAGFRMPIGDVATSVALPTQASGTLGLGYTWGASARDMVEAWARPGVVNFDPGALFFNFDGRLGWRRALGPRLSSLLTAGVFTAEVLANNGNANQQAEGRVLPVGSASLLGRLFGRARFTLDGSLSAGVSGFFDPVRGQVQPRAGGGAQLTATIASRWSVGLSSSVYTAATRHPLPPVPTPEGGTIAQSETVFLNQLPVSYRINDNATVEFGVIANFRTPHFRAPDFSGDVQTEVWGYLAFRVAGGTARGRREVRSRGGAVGGGAGANVGAAGTGAR